MVFYLRINKPHHNGLAGVCRFILVVSWRRIVSPCFWEPVWTPMVSFPKLDRFLMQSRAPGSCNSVPLPLTRLSFFVACFLLLLSCGSRARVLFMHLDSCSTLLWTFWADPWQQKSKRIPTFAWEWLSYLLRPLSSVSCSSNVAHLRRPSKVDLDQGRQRRCCSAPPQTSIRVNNESVKAHRIGANPESLSLVNFWVRTEENLKNSVFFSFPGTTQQKSSKTLI